MSRPWAPSTTCHVLAPQSHFPPLSQTVSTPPPQLLFFDFMLFSISIFGFLFVKTFRFESGACYSLMTKFALFLTVLFPPQPLSGGCNSILAKVCVRCMALTRFMLLPILCLYNITALCSRFLCFCPSSISPNSLWFFGIIYASIAHSVCSSFPFSKINTVFYV